MSDPSSHDSKPSRDPEHLIVRRNCSGGCGTALHYQLATSSEPFVPDMHCLDGNSYYRGGHLCNDCETAVSDVLARRRERLQREALERPRSQRKAQVRERESARGKR